MLARPDRQGNVTERSAPHPTLLPHRSDTTRRRHDHRPRPTTGDVRKARPADAAAVASALAAAFTDDPVFRWILPDDTARPAATRAFFDLVVEILAPHDDTWTTTAGVTGAALWVPAGRAPMSDERAERFAAEMAELCAPHGTGSWSWSA